MKNILVTGGAGFIGSNLARQLIRDKEHHVVIFDNFLTGYNSNIPVNKQVTLVRGDVNEANELMPVMNAYEFHYVFHYAAMVGVNPDDEGL